MTAEIAPCVTQSTQGNPSLSCRSSYPEADLYCSASCPDVVATRVAAQAAVLYAGLDEGVMLLHPRSWDPLDRSRSSDAPSGETWADGPFCATCHTSRVNLEPSVKDSALK